MTPHTLTMKLLLLALCCAVTVYATGDIGPGVWHVVHIKKCDLPQHKFKFDLSLKKINRTHDAFQGKLIIDADLNDDYGIRLDICKEVDGGCKAFQMLSDNSFIEFVNKYAKANIEACFASAGVEPPKLPVKMGEYELNNFIFDYSELPSDGPYGTFGAKIFVLQGPEEVSCVEMHLEFEEAGEDDD